MFGKSVFISKNILFLLLVFFALTVSAVQRVSIKNDQAEVYQSPSFDSPVVTYLPAGKVYKVADRAVNYFYKIEYAPGKAGYIIDTDLNLKASAKKKTEEEESPLVKKTEKKPKKKKAFEWSRYVGVNFLQMTYRESAFGRERKSTIPFVGFKMSGPYTLLEGPTTVDFNILYSNVMPDYYKELSGKEATGSILLIDFFLYSNYNLSRSAFIYYGFGPMLKYSKITANFSQKFQSQQVLDVGLVFSLGTAIRLGTWDLRPEATYYLEKHQYNSLGIGLQTEF